MTMTDHGPPIEPARVEQTTTNIRLAGRFVRDVLADPSLLDRIPSGATLVLMPTDNPKLAWENFALAEQLAGEIENVRLRPVGLPGPEAAAWRDAEMDTIEVKALRPRWAVPLQDPLIAYDRDRDVLLVDFSRGQRRGIAGRLNAYALLLVHLETQEAFGYVVPNFLARVVPDRPRMGELLRFAELRSIAPDELGGVVDEADQPNISPAGNLEELLSELSRSSA